MHQKTNPAPAPTAPTKPATTTTPRPPQPPSQGPRCGQCSGATVRAGTCYVCLGCGTTTGCS
jgi:hypothetical protein